MNGVEFTERPQEYQGFLFTGGYESFKQFLMWVYDRGFIAAYQPDLTWERNPLMDAPNGHTPEMIHICKRGYIKGSSPFTTELYPGEWFIIGLNGEPFTKTKEEVEQRFVAKDAKALHYYDEAMKAHRLYQGGS